MRQQGRNPCYRFFFLSPEWFKTITVCLGTEDRFTAEKLKANVECGVHYLLFFQTWYFSVQYFYFTLLLYQRLGQPLNLRSICMTAFNLKKSGHLILQTKRKYRNVLNYWSIYCPHKMPLCRQWQQQRQQTNRQNAARRINNCNFSIVSEERVRVGVQIRFARQISPVLRANIYSALLINLGHYLQPLQMLFCHIVYLDHPFVSGL